MFKRRFKTIFDTETPYDRGQSQQRIQKNSIKMPSEKCENFFRRLTQLLTFQAPWNAFLATKAKLAATGKKESTKRHRCRRLVIINPAADER